MGRIDGAIMTGRRLAMAGAFWQTFQQSMFQFSSSVSALFLPGILGAYLLGIEVSPAASEEIYGRDIKPVLRERCYACHGALKQKSGLRLDTAERLKAGADEGKKPIVTPAASAKTVAFRRASATAAR